MSTVRNVLNGVTTAWGGQFEETNQAISNVMWLAFFPVRAISTLAQNALLVVFVGAASTLAIISVLLKSKTGIAAADAIMDVHTWICAFLPQNFDEDDHIQCTKEQTVTNCTVDILKKAWKGMAIDVLEENIICRILWSLFCPVQFCFFAFGVMLIAPAAIANAGAQAMLLMGNGLCDL
ncbi:MAG: hypothetical protein LBC42_02710 [Puniceicoccales bacterium]|jgi:hypothetical protein|nr:hypothetical protein [Puniceicoccales bacterium]